jgi:hypothetical protein
VASFSEVPQRPAAPRGLRYWTRAVLIALIGLALLLAAGLLR